uniref:conjugal transfer protein TraF n=1 Tax=Parerythrobacter lutipelagi TaxID=1964208 RepID=UPI0010F52E04
MTHFYRTALVLGVAALSATSTQAQERQGTPSTTAADTLYCEERRLGYWFYCVKPPPAQELQQPEVEPVPASQELDAITSELRELKARAILYPTEANVAAYIRFQRAQLDRASLFSDVWQRAIWQDPELDYTLERPVGAVAKKQWQDARSAERDHVMARLS